MEVLSAARDLDAWTAASQIPTTWPVFMLQDPTARHLPLLERLHPDYHFALFDRGRPVAYLRSTPVAWDTTAAELPARGWDAAVEAGADLDRRRDAVTTACLLEAAVHPDHQGQGVSGALLTRARQQLAGLGVEKLLAPVRPSHKHLQPRQPMQDYARQVRADGTPADPWLRVHTRLGGRIVTVCSVSMTIAGTLDQWCDWVGFGFTVSGAATVAGALAPVHVDLDQDHAVYVEPNVWVQHDLTSPRPDTP